MRRIERFWAWDAKRWQARAGSQPAVAEARIRIQGKKDKDEGITRAPPTDFQRQDARSVVHGKIAYAVRQARIRTRLLEEAKRQHQGLPALLEGGPPLIECTEEVPDLLGVPVIPKKPIHPGGRAHRSRNDSYQPKQRVSPPGDSEQDEEELDVIADEGEVRILAAEDDEDSGKTYDNTDDES